MIGEYEIDLQNKDSFFLLRDFQHIFFRHFTSNHNMHYNIQSFDNFHECSGDINSRLNTFSCQNSCQKNQTERIFIKKSRNQKSLEEIQNHGCGPWRHTFKVLDIR